MRIKDIPFKKVRKAALKNQGVWRDKKKNIDTFDWHLTPQGKKFWKAVNEGNYHEAKLMYPRLFKELVVPVAVGRLRGHQDWIILNEGYDEDAFSEILLVKGYE